MKIFQNHTVIFLITIIVVSLFGNIFLYSTLSANKDLALVQQKNNFNREKILAIKIDDLQKEYLNTLSVLELNEEEKKDLAEKLEKKKDQLEEIEDDYNRINETVGQLVKLSETDEELLQKYSRVYFLNENYSPSALQTIEPGYLIGSKNLQVHAEVWPFLQELLEDAYDDDMDMKILSAYRSFQYQQQIKQNYLTIYGSGANQFSADQGFSEHQLGTTVDFTTRVNGSSLSLFEKTAEFRWLEKNAYKYGFVLSYPKNNSFYQYEPWHWRFVGKDLAKYLHKNNLYFYDLDQRDINEYLINIFED